MSIFSRSARRQHSPNRAKTGARSVAALRRDEVAVAFELLVGRRPIDQSEIEAASRLGGLRELVDYLLATEEFAHRYQELKKSGARGAPCRPAVIPRPAPIFLGDRVLCWTHRGQRLYVVPQDVDITPRVLLDGTWELHVEATMLRFMRPGYTVIDCGANIGYYTIILCAAVAPQGKVYAFEAQPDLVRLLKATIYINGLGHLIELQCCAVSDRAGSLILAQSPDHHGSGNVVPGHFIPTYDDNYPIRIEVPAVTLDAALGDRVGAVDLIHMDIEGSEPLALRGAQALIERSPGVKIITEWSVDMMGARADLGEFVVWLKGLGFRFWVIDRESAELTPVEANALLGLPHGDLLLSRTDLG